VLNTGPVFEQVLASRRERGAQNPMRAVALVTVTRALPLISPAYNQGLSEDEMRVIYRRFFETLWSGRADAVGKPE
jgi:hypothetical protein